MAYRLPRLVRFRINSIAYYRAKHQPTLKSYRSAYRFEKAKLTAYAAELLAFGLSEADAVESLRDPQMELMKTLRKLAAAIRATE